MTNPTITKIIEMENSMKEWKYVTEFRKKEIKDMFLALSHLAIERLEGKLENLKPNKNLVALALAVAVLNQEIEHNREVIAYLQK